MLFLDNAVARHISREIIFKARITFFFLLSQHFSVNFVFEKRTLLPKFSLKVIVPKVLEFLQLVKNN